MFVKNSKKNIKHIIRHKIFFIIPAVLFQNLAILSYYQSLKTALLSKVVPIINLSTLTTTLLGGEMFHEHKLMQKIIASIIMLIGTYILLI